MTPTRCNWKLACAVAKRTGYGKEPCAAIIAEAFALIADDLQRGRAVKVHGFGIFRQVNRKARFANDSYSQDKGRIYIPAHKAVTFKAVRKNVKLCEEGGK